MNDLDEEVHQTINDLLSPLPTEGRKEGVTNRLRVSPPLTGRLGRSTEPILPQDFWLYLSPAKRLSREAASCLNLAQLLQLTKHTLETDTTRVRLQDTERGTVPV